MSTQAKYYAVLTGHNPGVYTTWAECKEQTHKFPGAVFQRFPTLHEAQAFLVGPSAELQTERKFYAVRVGRMTGVYRTWYEAHAVTHRHPGAVFQGFSMRAEAEAWCARL